MALITPQPRIERDKVAVRLDRQTTAKLRLYAEWLQSSQEWVINRALEHLFARDKDFQAHLRTKPASPGSPASRAPARSPRAGKERSNDAAGNDRVRVADTSEETI